jgi:multiple inositol-polyphosphate phosphatase/2,3-bisphosphoglycerate 3-phosphatase
MDVLDMFKLEEYLQHNPLLLQKIISTNSALNFLKDWRNPFNIESAGELHPVGMDHLYEIAMRLRKGELASLVDERGYSPHRHRFSSSEVSRTLQSAQVWSTGFFYNDHKKDSLGENLSIESHPKKSDWLLRFFEACESFQNAVDREDHHEELRHFVAQAFHGEDGLYTSFVKRLGLEPGEFDVTHIRTMHRVCSFEASLNKTDHHFCSLFNSHDLDAFEYVKDLSFYWTRSHGNPNGTRLAAPLLRKILENLEQHAHFGDRAFIKEPEVIHFMFGHAETLVPLLSLIGLYNHSDHWKHDTPKESWSNRIFKSSQISPFSANIGLLLYHCDDRPFVRVLHNEQEVIIPGCDEVMCPWNEFQTTFQHLMELDLEPHCQVVKGMEE